MKDKTIPKATPKRVKGTVLFTVVATMMILVVFLMGTLSLAATVTKRAQTKYQKEQTEYTARAALDAVENIINQDTEGKGIKMDIANTSKTGEITLTVTVPQRTSGGALVNHDCPVTIRDTGQKRNLYYEDKWIEIPLYEVSVDVSSATTTAETVYTAYMTANLNTGSSGGGGGGGAFVAMGNLTGDLGTGGYITGGSFINVLGLEQDRTDGTPRLHLGNYTLGTAGGGTTIDAPVYIYGNVSSGSKVSYVHYAKEDEFFGIEGDFTPCDAGFHTVTNGTFNSNFEWKTNPANPEYDDIPVFYVGGLLNAGGAKVSFGTPEIPVNVFTGTFELGNAAAAEAKVYGDLYSCDPTGTSLLCSDGFKKLYKWAAGTIKNEGTNHLGNVYTAGNLNMAMANNSIEIDGNVNVAGNLTIGRANSYWDGTKMVMDIDTSSGNNKEITIKGDLVIGGELSVPSQVKLKVEGAIYAAKISNGGGTIECASTHTFEASGFTPTETYAGGTKIGDRVVTYEFKNGDGYDNGIRMDYAGDNATMTLSYKTTTIETKNGVISTPDEKLHNDPPITKSKWDFGYPDAWKYNAQQCVENGGWSAYNEKRAEFDAAIAAGGTVVQDIFDYDIASRCGLESVFPEKYLSENMPDALFEVPTATAYTTGYLTDINKLAKNIYDETNSAFSSSGHYNPDLVYTDSSSAYTNDISSKGYFEINSSAVLKGNMSKGNIYVNPTADTIIVLDNFSMDEDHAYSKPAIIVNDKYKVTFFVKGYCSLKCEGMITTNYLKEFCGIDANAADFSDKLKNLHGLSLTNLVTIPQEVNPSNPDEAKYLPNVIIYGQKDDSTLDLNGNNVVLTAQVRAPEMVFKQKMGKNASVKYNYKNGSSITYNSGDNTCIGVIGQLIAKEITLDNSAKWGMIYVTEPDSADKRCPACQAAGCSCTGEEGCACSVPGCTCPKSPVGDSYADKLEVIYYDIY